MDTDDRPRVLGLGKVVPVGHWQKVVAIGQRPRCASPQTAAAPESPRQKKTGKERKEEEEEEEKEKGKKIKIKQRETRERN
jgi:hypothetical protein